MRIAVVGGTGVAGRYTVEAARAAGHDAVALSRSTGVDVETGEGLKAALAGVDVVVDASNAPSTGRRRATAFFEAAARNLQESGAAAGVRHLVVLSIVGVDRVPGFAYYDAKQAHEAAARTGPLPVRVLRATQFHEFAGQLLDRLAVGPVAPIPSMRVRPVAARTVGEHLVAVAVGPDLDRPAEVAGPEALPLVDLARRTARARGTRTLVVPLHVPGRAGAALRSGALLPGSDAVVDGPGPEAWIRSADFR